MREKSITRTGQDRTGQQKKSQIVIFHIFGVWLQAPRKGIAMKFGTGVDVHDVAEWAEFKIKIKVKI